MDNGNFTCEKNKHLKLWISFEEEWRDDAEIQEMILRQIYVM